MGNLFESDAVWDCLVEQCLSGNLTAMKLYFELMEKAGLLCKSSDHEKNLSDAREAGVVIVDDISKTRKKGK